MPTFRKSVVVEAPVETEFRFHGREDALRLLSPAFPAVRMVRKQGGIETGSTVELRIGPLRWVALRTAFQKNRFFEGQQISGPFANWIRAAGFAAVRARAIPSSKCIRAPQRDLRQGTVPDTWWITSCR